MKKTNTIIHVEFHDGPRKGENHYFGSIKAIFEKIPKKELRTSTQMLYRFKIEMSKPYKNKVCTIRRDTIGRKPGNRTAPIRILRVQG